MCFEVTAEEIAGGKLETVLPNKETTIFVDGFRICPKQNPKTEGQRMAVLKELSNKNQPDVRCPLVQRGHCQKALAIPQNREAPSSHWSLLLQKDPQLMASLNCGQFQSELQVMKNEAELAQEMMKLGNPFQTFGAGEFCCSDFYYRWRCVQFHFWSFLFLLWTLQAAFSFSSGFSPSMYDMDPLSMSVNGIYCMSPETRNVAYSQYGKCTSPLRRISLERSVWLGSGLSYWPLPNVLFSTGNVRRAICLADDMGSLYSPYGYSSVSNKARSCFIPAPFSHQKEILEREREKKTSVTDFVLCRL